MNRYWADVSNNNPQQIQWKTYAQQGQHVLVGLKASEGETFVDKTHATRSENAHGAGVWVLHYHFGHPESSPTEQAQFFWSQIHGHFAARDFACLDIETGSPNAATANWCKTFISHFYAVSGHSSIVYASESYLRSLRANGLRWPGERAWIAAYGPRKPSIAGVSTWAWQFTDGQIGPNPHSCAGIGNCDISELNWGTYLRLRLKRA
jgi:lysozyme